MEQKARTKTIAVVVVIALLALIPGRSAAEQSSHQQRLAQQPAQPETNLGPVAELFADHIHPNVLARAEIDTSSFSVTLNEVVNAQEQLTTNQQRITQLGAELEQQVAAEQQLTIDLAAAADEVQQVNLAAGQARNELASLAIATFQHRPLPQILEYTATGEITSDPVLIREVSNQMKQNHRELLEDKQAKEQHHERLGMRLVETTAQILQTEQDLIESQRQIEAAQATLDRLTPQLISEVLLAPLTNLPFPVVVLDAYYKAQLSTAVAKPDCQVKWNQLAGIGKVETRHGTYGSVSVSRDGRTSSEILGPQLDGDPFRAIPDTDGGRLDGNGVWDHAVGPMQFIPSSWSIYGADGNRDQIQDPHNMYDAALAAANHLCGSRRHLAIPANFTSALFGYNRSVSYGNDVKRHAAEYSAVLNLPG